MSARDAAILVAAGALLELPALLKHARFSSKRHTYPHYDETDDRLYYHLRNALNRSLSYGAIYAVHASSAWLLRLLLRRLGLASRPAGSLRWVFAALCSFATQLALPDPLPGLVCALMVPRSVAQLLAERFPSLRRVPQMYMWAAVATAMNLQLWTQFHRMAPRWREIMMGAAGLSGHEGAILHRSETREVVPCDDPSLGIHPGEGCVESALGALRRGA